MSTTQSSRWDKTGIVLSTICILHCLLMPVISAYLLVLGMNLGSDDLFHRLFLLVLAGAGLLAFLPGMRKHSDHRVLFLAGFGFAILAFMAFVGHDVVGHEREAFVNITGSVILIFAHIWNHILTRKSECCHHEKHD